MRAGAMLLDAGRLRNYMCDFQPEAQGHRCFSRSAARISALRRGGGGNCAVMVAASARFSRDGNIVNAVNFPNVALPRESSIGWASRNANVPNMWDNIDRMRRRAQP